MSIEVVKRRRKISEKQLRFRQLVFSTTKLREKCPNTELFLVRIFPHSDWIRRYTPYLSVFSPNAEKYGPEKLCIWTLFTQYINPKIKRDRLSFQLLYQTIYLKKSFNHVVMWNRTSLGSNNSGSRHFWTIRILRCYRYMSNSIPNVTAL